jgi:hypothetical protein
MDALPTNLICVTRPKMGRKMLYPDKIVAPLPAGTLSRIAAALKPGEDKTDLLREAVETELKKRERQK